MKNNICRVLIAIALLLSTSAFLAGEACAQDEYEGFFKRMMKRFQKEDTEAVGQKKYLEPKEVESAKPARPSVPLPRITPVTERPVPVKAREAKVVPTAPKAPEIKVPQRGLVLYGEEMGSLEQVETELSREDMIGEINEMLGDNEDIFSVVPMLRKNTDEKGNVYYTYDVGGVAERLEDLSTLDLDNLYMRIMTESGRLNTQRILQQLEQIRRTQRVITGPPATPSAPRIPRTPPAMPNIPLIPRTPSAPVSPPQAPSAPATPAAPPAVPARR